MCETSLKYLFYVKMQTSFPVIRIYFVFIDVLFLKWVGLYKTDTEQKPFNIFYGVQICLSWSRGYLQQYLKS